MMQSFELKPAKSMTESLQLDKDSVDLFKRIINRHHINDSQLEKGGTLPTIDGYLELLDDEDYVEAKVTVQIKHLTYPANKNGAYYDIPSTIIAYAQRIKGEVVIFIACDTDKNTCYWKHIDESFIEDCYKIGHQQTYRYHFKSNEKATARTIEKTLTRWRMLYHERVNAIQNEQETLYNFITIQKQAFDKIPSGFYGLPYSYIERKEVITLFQWINNKLQREESPVKLLVGNAGVGKSVVLKSLISKLDSAGIKSLSIKADRSDISSQAITLQSLQNSINLLSSQQHKVVLIVDQIDALSQCMSNDRDKINSILNLVSSLKKQTEKEVRMIISCRKYDLLFDASLRQLGVEEAIELGCFSNDEIKNVVNLLSPEIFSKLPHDTRHLLGTAQFLDTFCRLYFHGRHRLDYNNYFALYDELWEHLTDDAPAGIIGEPVESFLFKVSDVIQKSDTLAPHWSIPILEKPIANYLASEGVLLLTDGQISFFHQTFLDYCCARHYCVGNHSFVSDLENSFQGLEIRARIKSILEYERSHSENHYYETINEVLENPQIRTHIKLIVISLISTCEKPSKRDIKLVYHLKDNNETLFSAFINGATNAWLPILISPFLRLAPSITKDAKLFYPILGFLFRYVSSYTKEVVDFVNAIEEPKTKEKAACWILHGDIDYQESSVQQLFSDYVANKPEEATTCLKSAIKTNISFVTKQVDKLLVDYLTGDQDKKKGHDDYILIEVLSKQLFELHPKLFFEMMFNVFITVIEQKRITDDYYWFARDSVFEEYNSDHYTNQLFGWLEKSAIQMAVDPVYIRPFCIRLFQTQYENALRLAFQIMTVSPSYYIQEIEELFCSNESIDKYLEYSSFTHYFLELLKAWYLTLSPERALKYQHFILSFRSRTDSIPSKERRYNRYYFPYLWKRKWELLYTVEEHITSDELRRCRLELGRRFGGYYNNPKEKQFWTTASYCGGLTSSEKYQTFSKKAWFNSFISINSGGMRFRHFDERIHANEFKTCVSLRPNYFRSFVEDLFINTQVGVEFKAAGLLGLLGSGLEPREVLHLFRQFQNDSYMEQHPYDFIQMGKHYRSDDGITEEIVIFYEQYILSHIKADKAEEAKDLRERSNNLINNAINSPAGYALDALIDISEMKQHRAQIYGILCALCKFLTPSLRLLVLFKTYVKEYYDENLFYLLLQEYLPYADETTLFVRGDMFQQYFYFKNVNCVDNLLYRLQSKNDSHELLAQIYFFGSYHKRINSICLERLYQILDVGDEQTIARMVRVAYKEFSDKDFSDLSKNILIRFADDDREKVRQAYLFYCVDLPIMALPFFLKISANWKPNIRREYYDLLKYLMRCAAVFPEECLLLVERQKLMDNANPWTIEEELTQLLIMIYKKLKMNDNITSLNKLMDFFDVMILRGNKQIANALEDMEA